MSAEHSKRLEYARLAVEGLALGDSFGQQFFYRESWSDSPSFRRLPPPTWRYTDDTEMALAIYETLEIHGEVIEDTLAELFIRRYELDPYRGYGNGVQEILRAIGNGATWKLAASSAFEGQGSFGNGGAMRVAPVGAYFAEDLDRLVLNAERSAVVTHMHPEGVAGALAVAIAASWARQNQTRAPREGAKDFFAFILAHTPSSETRRGIEEASRIPLQTWEFHVAEQLGNGSKLSSMDTVPLCIWLSARYMDDYCEALWNTAALGGDIDTNCAIVGSIVSLAVGQNGLPDSWLERRESLQWHA